MLSVKIHTDKDDLCLSMAGHAGAGKKGTDIVCAAASILAYTAAAEMLRLHREGILHTPPVIRLTPGAAWVEAKNCREAAVAFSALATGFRLLAVKYPNHVKLEEIYRKERVYL